MITKVQKSRKEYKCSKCGKTIPAGSSYLRGDLNFSKPIIRCVQCGLKHYEVTTSDYVRSVGAIVEDWPDFYTADECGRDEMVAELESIMDDLQDRLDNMPEGLQQGDTGMLLEERISSLEAAISDLESIDFEEVDEADEDTEEDDYAELINNALSNIDY